MKARLELSGEPTPDLLRPVTTHSLRTTHGLPPPTSTNKWVVQAIWHEGNWFLRWVTHVPEMVCCSNSVEQGTHGSFVGRLPWDAIRSFLL